MGYELTSGKSFWLRHSWSSYDVWSSCGWGNYEIKKYPHDAMAYTKLIGHRDIQLAMGTILDPYQPNNALHWHYFLSHNFTGSAKCS